MPCPGAIDAARGTDNGAYSQNIQSQSQSLEPEPEFDLRPTSGGGVQGRVVTRQQPLDLAGA